MAVQNELPRATHFQSLAEALSHATLVADEALKAGDEVPEWARRTIRDHRGDNDTTAAAWSNVVTLETNLQRRPQLPETPPSRKLQAAESEDPRPTVEIEFLPAYQHSAPSVEHPDGVIRHKIRLGDRIVDLSDVERRIVGRLVQTPKIDSTELWAEALAGHKPVTLERKRSIKKRLTEKTMIGDQPLITYTKGLRNHPSEWSISGFNVRVVDPKAEQDARPTGLKGLVARAGTLLDRRGQRTPPPARH